MWGTNPMPSSHRVLFWVLGKLLMKDDIWAVFRDREQKWPENRRNGALNKTQKNSEICQCGAYCICMVQLSLRSAVEDITCEQNRKQPVWHILVPDVPYMLPPVENTLGTESCFCWLQRWDLKQMCLEDCQESSKREPAPRKMSLQEPGVGAVLVGMVSSPVPQPPQKASALAPVTFQWCRSQMGMVGTAKTLLPSELLQKTIEKF